MEMAVAVPVGKEILPGERDFFTTRPPRLSKVPVTPNATTRPSPSPARKQNLNCFSDTLSPEK
jgi:hypothetical protein